VSRESKATTIGRELGGLTNDTAGGIALSDKHTFRFSVSEFKRQLLPVSPEFLAAVFGDSQESDASITIIDQDETKYAALVDRERKVIDGLGPWYRRTKPAQDAQVVLEPAGVCPCRRFFVRCEGTFRSETQGLLLGHFWNMTAARKREPGDDYRMPVPDLLTHVFICGVTGKGKTVLGKAIIEEAALRRIPSILVDLKGDLSSMALCPTSFSPEWFEEWVEATDPEERKEKARREAQRHREELARFRLGERELQAYRENVAVRIFTPRSNKGIPVSLASQLQAPPEVHRLEKESPEDFRALARSLTDALVSRLYPGRTGSRREKIENERNFLYEIVSHAWLHGISLDGLGGLETILNLVDSPPFETIGGLPVPQYIDAENRRNRLLNKINTLISGPEVDWFDGQPLAMDLFLEAPSGKTPVNIVNLAELDTFEDRSFVVANLAYKIWEWTRRQPGTDEPRLVFFIDEIGGGGGKQALFPSYPYECAAKWGLNYLLRQGRSFGVCCVFATQNPGDVDYKALSNCGTWMVGGLLTKRDRQKVMEGMAVSGRDADFVSYNLTEAQTGDFVVRDPRQEISYVRERWLLTYHRPLTTREVERLMHPERGVS